MAAETPWLTRRLKPLDAEDDEIVKVVVETPKYSRNKYAFDPDEKAFTLKKVLPAGMSSPHDFGFVPSTEAGDGDPLGVLMLMDEPAFPGVVVKFRLVGVIEGEQGSGKDTERNDRIVAVHLANHEWKHINHIDDLGKHFVKGFFVNYHELEGKEEVDPSLVDCSDSRCSAPLNLPSSEFKRLLRFAPPSVGYVKDSNVPSATRVLDNL